MPRFNQNKTIVLLSGGLDSTVCLWWAKSKGFDCRALSFNYGQRHKKELKKAALIAKAASVPFKVVRFTLPWGGSSLTNKTTAIPFHRPSQIVSHHIPSTYVPARNTLFLSFALSWADQSESTRIVIGANAIDYSGYPDCRPAYISSFEKVANLGTRLGSEGKKNIQILTPLIRLTKADIVKRGLKLKAPIEQTWSCYLGGRHPCQKCDSCLLREKGFKEAGVL